MESQLIEFLASVPHEKTRSFELNLTEYVIENSSAHLCEALEKLLSAEQDDRVAYNAFYCLNIIYRRTKDFVKLSVLFEKYSQKFARHITFSHLKVLFEIESGSMYDYAEVLNVTYKDSELFSDNAGFVHLFADVFATIYENGYIRDKQAYLDSWYDLALNAVNRAIYLDDEYAKYSCTKARILVIKNEFMEAVSYIDKAIGIEKSGRSDYILRICTYQYHKMMINVSRKIYEESSRTMQITNNQIIQKNTINKDDEQNNINNTMPIAYCGKEPYAFVSYSHMNFDETMSFVGVLQKSNIPIWFDEGIEAGSEYAEIIAERLGHASAFIFLITPDSIKSEFVRKELRMALDLKIKPICIYLKKTTLTPGMEIQLNIYEQIRKYEMSDDAFWRKVMISVKNSLGIE